jgi:hypothetical protein
VRCPLWQEDRVCGLQLLMVLVSTVILGSESHRTHDHILLSQILSPPHQLGGGAGPYIYILQEEGGPHIPPRHWVQLGGGGQVPIFVFSRNRVDHTYPLGTGFHPIHSVSNPSPASQPVCCGASHPYGAHHQTYSTVRHLQVCWCGHPSWWDDESVVYNCCSSSLV